MCKIQIKIHSDFRSQGQNDLDFDNPIEVLWDLPFLPRKGEYIELDYFTDSITDCYGLTWIVSSITYLRIDGIIVPELFLDGV